MKNFSHHFTKFEIISVSLNCINKFFACLNKAFQFTTNCDWVIELIVKTFQNFKDRNFFFIVQLFAGTKARADKANFPLMK